MEICKWSKLCENGEGNRGQLCRHGEYDGSIFPYIMIHFLETALLLRAKYTKQSINWLYWMWLRTPSQDWKKNKRKKERDVHIPCTFILHMLIPTCRSPMGNDWWNSVVIHNRNVLWMLSDSVIVSSISWQKSRLRWQFCSRSHFPVVMASVSSLRACASCPWPMEIDRISARGTSHVSGDEGRFREAEFLVMDFFFYS